MELELPWEDEKCKNIKRRITTEGERRVDEEYREWTSHEENESLE